MASLHTIRLIPAVLVTGALSAAPPACAAGTSAQGAVFFPNPVRQLGDQTLTGSKDADLPVFGPVYRRVTLTHLDGRAT